MLRGGQVEVRQVDVRPGLFGLATGTGTKFLMFPHGCDGGRLSRKSPATPVDLFQYFWARFMRLPPCVKSVGPVPVEGAEEEMNQSSEIAGRHGYAHARRDE